MTVNRESAPGRASAGHSQPEMSNAAAPSRNVSLPKLEFAREKAKSPPLVDVGVVIHHHPVTGTHRGLRKSSESPEQSPRARLTVT